MKFLVVCVHKHVDFRFPELDALCTLQGLNPNECYSKPSQSDDDEKRSTIEFDLPTIAHAQFFSERGICVKGVYEVLAKGSDTIEIIQPLIA